MDFCFVVKNGNLKIVKFLWKQNCGIDHENECGFNGFILSCQEGNLEIVKFLFKHKCGINHVCLSEWNGFFKCLCEK